jgi:hypothetical protein
MSRWRCPKKAEWYDSISLNDIVTENACKNYEELTRCKRKIVKN